MSHLLRSTQWLVGDRQLVLRPPIIRPRQAHSSRIPTPSFSPTPAPSTSEEVPSNSNTPHSEMLAQLSMIGMIGQSEATENTDQADIFPNPDVYGGLAGFNDFKVGMKRTSSDCLGCISPMDMIHSATGRALVASPSPSRHPPLGQTPTEEYILLAILTQLMSDVPLPDSK